jgi:predicted nucleic acid-binding protein
MISAVDTNILLDVLIPNNGFVENSMRALEESAASGLVVICDILYAELCIHFDSQRQCDHFLESCEIRAEPLTKEAHFLASRVWRTYRCQGGQRTKILSDFLIGAHAQTRANQLVSRDRGFYRKLFPSLKLIDPSVAQRLIAASPAASRHSRWR